MNVFFVRVAIQSTLTVWVCAFVLHHFDNQWYTIPALLTAFANTMIFSHLVLDWVEKKLM